MPRHINCHKTSQQGRRESNEDVESCSLNLLNDGYAENSEYAPIDFFIVCDGHGGDSVAKYVVPTMQKMLMKKNLIYPLTKNYINKIYETVQESLIKHPRKIARMCGCTALVLVRFIDKYHKECIQVINLGDCRAVLSKDGLAIPLTKDHKPFWSDEKHRIDMVNLQYGRNERVHFDAGDWRIGDLSVSRSFGDLDNTPYVTHIPDSYIYALDKNSEFIILACDGLWDVLENHEAINFVRDHINNNNIEYYNIKSYRNSIGYPSNAVYKSKCIARKLASYAIARGSSDNISIIIIFFEN